MFEDKYRLFPRDEQLLFEKNLVSMIYLAGKYENVGASLSQVKAIVENLTVDGVKPEDVQTVLNLKAAYQFVMRLHNVAEIDTDTIKQINLIVQGAGEPDAGQIRTKSVVVGLTNEDYVPPIPIESNVVQTVNAILHSETSVTDKAITLMLTLSRLQVFTDSNKRIVVANALMYQANVGLLAVPEKKMHWYLSQLAKYYKTGRIQVIKQWLYDHAVFGINES
ncbi:MULTISPECIES: Fic family protein [Lacticaseibacillus]|uniref:Fido domain-containing protein n=1 Tax=Lacticaseibacillus casei DSM 20011 = JCM 1134 = ATCC 393 TaxID=1423732 RepID=A0AAD1ES54_LACCA|nr:Fic family protein [Lacticaseibacillus casei]MBI6597762.1 Fic family protein [Lacticaseibacillus casei]MBO1481427.1 Fic family protein [Lacticaseibacillus casei]MBO2416707.1 Fic family protein [Lacticaseibacillus casei]MCK2081144.1 Fic family protein [Lacticaseibacillus casei]MDZ5495743.1 Fic family protein [Lacticaseibacillus casei]